MIAINLTGALGETGVYYQDLYHLVQPLHDVISTHF